MTYIDLISCTDKSTSESKLVVKFQLEIVVKHEKIEKASSLCQSGKIITGAGRVNEPLSIFMITQISSNQCMLILFDSPLDSPRDGVFSIQTNKSLHILYNEK